MIERIVVALDDSELAREAFEYTSLLAGSGRDLCHDRAIAEAVFRALKEIKGQSMIGKGRVYGGGLLKLEPSELASLPADMPGKTHLGLGF